MYILSNKLIKRPGHGREKESNSILKAAKKQKTTTVCGHNYIKQK